MTTETLTKPMTGTDIADAAQGAMRDPAFVDTPGQCQHFAREVAEAVGGEVARVMDTYRAGTARETLHNFLGTGYDIWAHGDGPIPALQEGDFLYKSERTSGPAGHVGIAANGRREGLPATTIIVYENSSYHENPVHEGNKDGAKGFRTLAQFGPFDLLVRLG